MWELYDRLIDGIPEGIEVTSYVSGDIWTMVGTKYNTGVAMTVDVTSMEPMLTKDPTEYDLKTLAGCAKSWNLREASIGIAAINAYYNKEPEIYTNSEALEGSEKEDAFVMFEDDMEGKKVAVIGHFPFIEKSLKDKCKLTILERNPGKGDYPDPACEYILADQDYILVTGSTLVNKTLPRLLQLKKNGTKLMMIGPSVTMSSVLYDYGADVLSGMVIVDADEAEAIIRKDSCRGIFKAGKMINLVKKQ